ncbi:MAG: aspartate-semialdehyde dehydrogenase [Candidatus Bathyarchaeota archaeon]|nr:aspartate-semialdehyde dehydrogenase [Candidatus Bathyarchaeota archaeon]
MYSVAVVGATGVVGQQFLVALDNHPWFKLECLAASPRSAGKPYIEALKGSEGEVRWFCDEPIPEGFIDMEVEDSSDIDPSDFDLIFTAVESDVASKIEPRYAEETPVVSTASAFRYEEDIPILVPGVNDEHTRLIEIQRKRRGWRGFITPIPNCTTTGLVVTLKPLMDEFGLERVIMTSMQALSGAGRSPGVLALDIIDNIIPYIKGEEWKVEIESKKILGSIANDRIEPADFKISCTCTRVFVKDGHTEVVYASLKRKASIEEVREAFISFGESVFKDSGLPSAPRRFIVCFDDPFRPQPRLDRDLHGGMAVAVGRIREDPALENGVKYILLSHNTRLGAAKGAVLVAELLVKEGIV